MTDRERIKSNLVATLSEAVADFNDANDLAKRAGILAPRLPTTGNMEQRWQQIIAEMERQGKLR